MIVKPKSVEEHRNDLIAENRSWDNDEALLLLYQGYRYELLRQFQEKYPKDRRFNFNYTHGFGREMKRWCDENDPGWSMIENYGYMWPLGFSTPQIAFAFKLRWGEPGMLVD